MVVFEALTWEARDEESEHLISIFGRTETGKSVCVTTAFAPYFFIKLPKNSTPDSSQLIYNKIKREFPAVTGFAVIKKKDLWGFQNNESFPFMKLNFSTALAMRQCSYKLRRPLKDDQFPLKMYESNIEPMLRLMHRSGIQSTGWLDTGDCIPSNVANVDIDLFCSDWTKLKPVDRDDIAPFILASFDIETNSSTGKFPSADIPEDACFQIAITLKRHGETELFDKTCLCYKKTDPDLAGCNIVSFETERELLLGFRDYLVKHDVDILTGWNIFGFDLEYVYKRSRMTGCEDEFVQISKFKNYSCEMSYKKLSSSALGDNELKLFPMPGRFIFDLFHEVKREKKLDSYSLNFVATTYLGDQKIDMSPKEMFRRFKEEDPVKLREVAEYCIKDTTLPHQIMAKLYTFINLIEMAKATWVPACYLIERGQQIKVFSQLTRTARELGFMVPTIQYGQVQSDPYQGATVLEAQSGAYYRPITALDFASLYPSIMRAHNLCYSTLVLDPKYDNLPGITYESFTVGEDENRRTYKFAQDVDSLLPKILNDLAEFRKKAKKDMANAVGDMKKVYDGKQLAYKVSMNSVYGFTGAGKGMLPCVAIASTVTCKGRSMIEETKNYVEANFPGAHVRYGDTDSVMVEFDVGDRTGVEAVEYSWQQGELASDGASKLFKHPNDLELEKVYYPYILYKKKKYAAKLWTKGKDGNMHMNYIDVKGLTTVRRDGALFVRETCSDILDIILESNNPHDAIELAKRKAVELLDGRVPFEKLILSQKLADTYKSDNLPHVQVVKKMREREPGSEPQSGDRVQFVIVEGDGDRQFEKSEDPKWVLANNIPLDYRYYFTNKFMNPVSDLLEPLIQQAKIFDGLLTKKVPRVDKNQKKITDIFAKKVKQ